MLCLIIMGDRLDSTHSIASLLCLCGQMVMAIFLIGIALGVWIIEHPDANLWEELAGHNLSVLVTVAVALLLLLCCLTSTMVILGRNNRANEKRGPRYIILKTDQPAIY